MTDAEREYVRLFTEAVLAAVERGTQEYFAQYFAGDPVLSPRALAQFTDADPDPTGGVDLVIRPAVLEALPRLSAAEVKRYIAQRRHHEKQPDDKRQAPELRCLPGGKGVHERTDDRDE